MIELKRGNLKLESLQSSLPNIEDIEAELASQAGQTECAAGPGKVGAFFLEVC